MSFRDQVAVVTGAASGIGLATVKGLRAAGARVYMTDLNVDAGREAAQRVNDEGEGVPPCEFVAMDVTDRASVEAAAKMIEARHGAITVLVNVAGWGKIEPFLQNDESFIDRVVDINFRGTINVVRAFLPAMVDAGKGKIVNVASDAGRVGSLGETVYSGAKGGVIAFTKSLARETARHGIAVNCVCPGPTDTPLLGAVPEKHREAFQRAIPMRRFAKPEEIADAIEFFASAKADYVTGQVLSVSGGLTMVD